MTFKKLYVQHNHHFEEDFFAFMREIYVLHFPKNLANYVQFSYPSLSVPNWSILQLKTCKHLWENLHSSPPFLFLDVAMDATPLTKVNIRTSHLVPVFSV